MDKTRAEQLFEKLRNDTLTELERAELESWYNHHAGQERPLNDELLFRSRLAQMDEAFPFEYRSVRRLWPRIAAAASILIACGTGLYFYLHNKPQQQSQQLVAQHDVPPGHNQATLTLANGQKIVLTNNLKGKIATQGKTNISANNQNIVYQNTQQEDQVNYNSLTTARGEQSPYPLVLADGTKVWLNAASSITFPTAFPGKERIVKLTGEAYFEVAHNSRQPFKVETNGQLTEDIGTGFDINSYTNEPAQRTTLVEGAIKVNGQLLKPGQQSLLTNNNIKIAQANLKQVLAWKNGEFRFDGQQIGDIMRQLERWYNIDVQYEGDISKEEFLGAISRYKNISQVLHMLSYNGAVHFKVEGRRVTVIR